MKWSEKIRKVLFPKSIWVFLMVNIMAVSLIFIFTRGLEKHWLGCIYILLFYKSCDKYDKI